MDTLPWNVSKYVSAICSWQRPHWSMMWRRKLERSVRWMLCAEWQSLHTGSFFDVRVTVGEWTLSVNSS